ncbi:hypothetical protein [Fodinicola feengrottensis]|uniref:hypothetical protein n=1 Tax=Fodinicola feengrottensis TaxID=435914 RepID=UPI0024421A93|nr:hypothetical protein [Fodinicola feengrottensis]
MTDRFASAKAIADTVLYEGYLLYPYRASAAKNQARWQFGVLMPPGFASPVRGEYDTCQCECLAEPGKDADLEVLVRFLRLQQRTAQALRPGDVYEDVPSLYAAEGEITTWVEAVAEEVSVKIPVADLIAADSTTALDVPYGQESEPLRSAEGELVGRVVRSRAALHGELRLHAEELDGPFGGVKIHAEIRNTTPWQHPNPYRDAALHAAFVATHALIGVSSGAFLSLLDPPEWAKVAVQECTNVRCWPVLLGAGDAVMASPIILYDFPTIAPESPADLFDGTEIDEILTLRTMAMTDEEKRQARATRAARALARSSTGSTRCRVSCWSDCTAQFVICVA